MTLTARRRPVGHDAELGRHARVQDAAGVVVRARRGGPPKAAEDGRPVAVDRSEYRAGAASNGADADAFPRRTAGRPAVAREDISIVRIFAADELCLLGGPTKVHTGASTADLFAGFN